ncbi:MAG TPA: FkbM family methyltransferase [Bacteroidia bacterium]|nr:FkbM family methyltransferase [Bacteroidia bacterium]
MKNAVKFLLQSILGYRRYIRFFASFKVKTLHSDSREKDFMHFLSMLPEEGTVLDIGANLGFLSVHIARHLSNGNVVAFEPMPDNLDALNYVVKKFKLKNVRVEACALGNEDGMVEMVLPVEGKAKQQGLSHVVHEGITEHNEGIRFKVPIRKLDDISFLFEPGADITGIKIDVENFEQYVLAGGQKLIGTYHPLLYIELWDNDNQKNCFRMMKELGYSVKVHVNGTLVDFNKSVHTDKINFFFVYGK